MRTFTTTLFIISLLWSIGLRAQCDTEFTCTSHALTCSTPEITFGCGVTGNAPFTFRWLDNNDNVISTDSLVTVGEFGIYTLEATDATDCVASVTVLVIEEVPGFDCNIIVDDGSCAAEPTILSVQCIENIAFFQWELDGVPISTEPQVNVVDGGLYCVTLGNEEGCIIQECILQPDPPAAPLEVELVVVEQPQCPQDETGSISAIVTGGTPTYSFTWSNTGSSFDLTDLAPGTYSITVLDLNGCTTSAAIELTPLLQADAGPETVSTCESAIRIGTTAPYTPALWFGSDAAQIEFYDSNQDPIPFEGINGFVTTNPTESNVPDDPDALHLYPDNTTTTMGQNICIPIRVNNFTDVTGMAFTLNYDTELLELTQISQYNSNLSGFGSDDIFNTIPGVLTVSWSDSDLTPTGLADGDILFEVCFDVIGSPQNFTFEWTGPNGYTSNQPMNTVAESGTYHLMVTNNNLADCSSEDEVVVNVNAGLTVELGNDTLYYCDDMIPYVLTADVQGGSGNYEYLWSTAETSPTIEVLPSPGEIYYVQVNDDLQGCMGVDSVVMMPHDPISLSFNVIDVSCHGGFDGCVEALPVGGTPPYTYTWNFGATGKLECNLPAGPYIVTITDSNGCTAEGEVSIGEPNFYDLQIFEAQAPTCESSNDGAITIIVTGGTPPYWYQWSTGDNVENLSGLPPGIYTVTVTDVNGCSITQSYELLPQIIADAGPDQLIDCINTTVTIDGTGSSTGPDISYEWTTSDGVIVAGANTLTPVIAAPGTYYLTVTDNSTPDCFSVDEVTVLSDFISPTLGFDLISCDSARVFFTPSFTNATIKWTYPDGQIVEDESQIGTVQSGVHELELLDMETGCFYTASILVELDPSSCTTLKGRLVQDTLTDCIPLASEPGLENWIMVIEGADELYFAVTQSDGYYEQRVPAGTYEVYPFLPSDLWIGCQDSYMVTLANPGDMEVQDIPVQEQEPCPSLSVDFSMPLMRACWSRSIHIHYCNDGTAMAADAFIEVTLDENFSFQSATLPVASQDGNTFTFDLGNVAVNDCGNLTVYFNVSCEVEIGQTLCAEAKIFPNEPCQSPDPLWSGASLSVSGTCEEDQVTFTVENTGTEDMDEPAACIVIEDGVMLFVIPDSLKLDAGESYEYEFPANGSTYRLEVAQVPFHPGFSMPLSVIEGCGENEASSFSTGFVNQFAMDDQDAFIDVECREVVGSFDPNDKHGFPRGYGDENLIYPGTPLEYLVNFQNTGNDTAFLVVIRDTLSEHLDITSVRPGGSSHHYTWDIDGDNVLVFTFENILLPDSTTNLEESQGFIEYKINQVAGLPLGTVIENSAAIYFDINDPVITNTTSHKLGKDFIEVVNLTVHPERAEISVSVIPNPANQEAQFTLHGWPSERNVFELFNSQGQQLMQLPFDGKTFHFRRGLLAEGLYFFRISGSSGIHASGQLMLSR
jgi:uncharacterized repeat protein (TIGR01451 family)